MAFGARERAIFEAARRQHGLVTYAQLAAAGVTRRLLSLRFRSGEWIRELPSVARMYWAERTWLQQVWAAWLWAGPLSAVSHFSAAALNGLGVEASVPVCVTVPARFTLQVPAPWVRVFRTRHLERRDVERLGGLRVTSPARTVIDLASQVPPDVLHGLVRGGLRLGAFEPGDLHRYYPQPRRGMKALWQILRTIGAPDRRQFRR